MSDQLRDRLAALRRRFSDQLIARIDRIETAASQLDRTDPGILARLHRDVHHLGGVGASLDFVETGAAARSIEQLLLAAIRAERAPTNEEISRLQTGIALLRSAASAEMRDVPAVRIAS